MALTYQSAALLVGSATPDLSGTYPAGIQLNDLLVVVTGNGGQFLTKSGWTTVASGSAIYTIATGTESGAVSFTTNTGSGSDGYCARLFVFRPATGFKPSYATYASVSATSGPMTATLSGVSGEHLFLATGRCTDPYVTSIPTPTTGYSYLAGAQTATCTFRFNYQSYSSGATTATWDSFSTSYGIFGYLYAFKEVSAAASNSFFFGSL